ncbi:MAG: xanthine dehydrogenase family protein molybdopterin-binding subunit [Acidothermales bacterium]|nr:xanthine dehydrogenase family protein molybdopterin-binding subunit [Acidothermales bacterium]
MTIYAPDRVLAASNWVGRRAPRKEDARHLYGRARFLDDLPFEGGAIAILRSPHPHARIVSVDTSRALADPRVLAVVTGEDVRRETSPVASRSVTAPVTQYVMAVDKVRWVGEPVVAIAAVDMFAAKDALDLVDVEYEPLPSVADVDAALAGDAPLIYDDIDSNVLVHDEIAHGPMAQAFDDAAFVVRETYRVGRFSSTPLEPYALTVAYDANNEVYDVVANDQQPARSIGNITKALGVPTANVRLSVPESGGSFGIKLAIWPYALIGCLLAKRAGRPLKWIQTRTEHMLGGTHTPDVKMEMELPVGADGKILAMRLRSKENDGAFIHTAGIYGLIKFATAVGPYTIGAASIDLMSVVTNRGPVVQNRGVGKPAMTFALERSVDRAARRLGMDPAEFRLRNMVPPEAMPYTTPAGEIYESGDYPETMRRALELGRYREFREKQAVARAEGRLLGIGLSAGIEPGTSNIGYYSLLKGTTDYNGSSEGAVVGIEVDGQVTVRTGSVDTGQGHETTICQVVADMLGITPEDISFDTFFDSTRSPYTGQSGAYSNRFNDVEVGAVITATERVRAKVRTLAAYLLEAKEEDLVLGDRAVHVAGDASRSVAFGELAKVAYNKVVLLPPDMEPGLRVMAYYRNPMAKPPDRGDFNVQLTHSNSVHVVVVEVDKGTGMLDFLKYAIVHDCGRQLNPAVVEGMAIGSTVHGIGGALLEEFQYDDAANPLATSFQTYLKPVAQTVPRIELGHLESPCPYTLLGTKATGEGGSITSLAAIGNAVEDALSPYGVQVNSLPITPEKILRGIRDGAPV